MQVTIVEVQEQTDAHHALLLTAGQLNQAKYVVVRETYIDESILLGAFTTNRCVGFLRVMVQVVGRDVNRPPIYAANGQPLREGYVEAFGVAPDHRRQGIGQRLQERAIALCRQRGCYQIRSRSPITSQENYALKLKMGYAVHPSGENDSYYFIKTLTSG
jgi:GNAT superfamily N-acetyltransferase